MTDTRSHGDEGSLREQLSALNPDTDTSASERFEQAVVSQIASRDAAPFVPTDPLYGLWSLSQPVLLAASIVTLAVLGISVSQRQRPRAAPATIAESMGVPPQLLAPGAR